MFVLLFLFNKTSLYLLFLIFQNHIITILSEVKDTANYLEKLSQLYKKYVFISIFNYYFIYLWLINNSQIFC